jgi:hypothetical protein
MSELDRRCECGDLLFLHNERPSKDGPGGARLEAGECMRAGCPCREPRLARVVYA